MTRLREFRIKKSWTQAELARRSGVSRSAIAAIENGALVPSVHAALALARSLDCTVEELFGDKEGQTISWAWQPSQDSPAFWEASFDQKVLAFPVEHMHYGSSLNPVGKGLNNHHLK